ncbi:hypothetical protein Tco_1304185 [Tanacetum coccineum]
MYATPWGLWLVEVGRRGGGRTVSGGSGGRAGEDSCWGGVTWHRPRLWLNSGNGAGYEGVGGEVVANGAGGAGRGWSMRPALEWGAAGVRGRGAEGEKRKGSGCGAGCGVWAVVQYAWGGVCGRECERGEEGLLVGWKDGRDVVRLRWAVLNGGGVSDFALWGVGEGGGSLFSRGWGCGRWAVGSLAADDEE